MCVTGSVALTSPFFYPVHLTQEFPPLPSFVVLSAVKLLDARLPCFDPLPATQLLTLDFVGNPWVSTTCSLKAEGSLQSVKCLWFTVNMTVCVFVCEFGLKMLPGNVGTTNCKKGLVPLGLGRAALRGVSERSRHCPGPLWPHAPAPPSADGAHAVTGLCLHFSALPFPHAHPAPIPPFPPFPNHLAPRRPGFSPSTFPRQQAGLRRNAFCYSCVPHPT